MERNISRRVDVNFTLANNLWFQSRSNRYRTPQVVVPQPSPIEVAPDDINPANELSDMLAVDDLSETDPTGSPQQLDAQITNPSFYKRFGNLVRKKSEQL